MHKYGKIYGSYKTGANIYRDKKGYYIVAYTKAKGEFKKHLKCLINYI